MRNRSRGALALLSLVLALGGCRYEGSIDDKGGGEVKLHYRVPPNTTIEKASKDLESKAVTIVSKALSKDGWMDATVKTADVTQLSTAAYFRAWAITLADGKDPGTKTLTARFTNKTPSGRLPESALDYYGKDIQIVLTLPGEIVASNATSTKDKVATWTWPTTEFFKEKQALVEVTYKVAAATPAK